MSYVRWSTKVVQDCPECGNEHWFALLPDSHPDWLMFTPDLKKYPDRWADDYPRLPRCCTSCWYVYESDRGITIHHSGGCVDFEDVTLSAEDGLTWEPPEGCRHAKVGRDAVRECANDMLGAG